MSRRGSIPKGVWPRRFFSCLLSVIYHRAIPHSPDSLANLSEQIRNAMIEAARRSSRHDSSLIRSMPPPATVREDVEFRRHSFEEVKHEMVLENW